MLDVLETFCEPASARDLSLSNEARRAFDDIAANNEAELGVSGDLAGLRDWGSKLPGRVARTATLIEVARSGPRAEAVSFESMMAAAVMSHRLTAHAKSAFGIVGVDPAQADARALLEWVRARGELLFSSAQAQKALEHRFRKVDQLRAAAAVLTSWGVLSVPQQQKNERARASTIWMVNPAALEPAP